MATKSTGSRRAALRQQQEAQERAQRNKRIMFAAIGIAAVIIIAVIAIVVTQLTGRGTAAEEQLTPPNASDGYGIYVQGKTPVEGTPHVVVWSDYQCPGCASYDQMYGPVIEDLVTSGDITAEMRQAHFLDGQASLGPSKRASIATAAADEVGFFDAYHHTLYSNQDSGYTDQVLRELIPASVGMDGDALARFQELYDGRAYEDWVDGANQKFQDDEVNSTPSYFVNDQRLELYDRENEVVLVEPEREAFLAAAQGLS